MKKGMKDVEKDYRNEVRLKQQEADRNDSDFERIDVLRAVLDDLPDDKRISISMSDFWLGMEKQVGIKRREINPPEPPFTKGKRPQLAEVGKIRDWDKAIIAVIKRDAELAELSRTRNKHHTQMTNEVNKRFEFICVQGTGVVGQVHEIEPAQFKALLLQQSERLVVRNWTMKQALLSPWLDQEARNRWIQRWEQACKDKIETLRRAVSEQERLFELTRAEINFVGLGQFNRTGTSIRKAKPII